MNATRVWGERASLLAVAGLAVLGSAFAASSVALASSDRLAQRQVARPAPAATANEQTSPPVPETELTGMPELSRLNPQDDSTLDQLCTVMSIRFATGAPKPGVSIGTELNMLAAHLAQHPEAHVRIHGHADARGTDGGNLILSRQRAFAVAAQLQTAGVSSTSMTVQAYGSFTPIEGVPAWSGDNRRVDVFLRGAPCPNLRKVVGP